MQNFEGWNGGKYILVHNLNETNIDLQGAKELFPCNDFSALWNGPRGWGRGSTRIFNRRILNVIKIFLYVIQDRNCALRHLLAFLVYNLRTILGC